MSGMIDGQIVVYSKPSCVQCTATYRAFDSKGIPYRVVDLSEDPAALAYVQDLGYLQAPSLSSTTKTTGPDSAPTTSNASPNAEHTSTCNATIVTSVTQLL